MTFTPGDLVALIIVIGVLRYAYKATKKDKENFVHGTERYDERDPDPTDIYE